MRSSRTALSSLGVAIFLLFAAGSAEALRCHGDIVGRGDSTMELISKCGEPTQVERIDRWVSRHGYDARRDEYYTEESNNPYEIWTYNFGPNRLLTLITIEGGKIRYIQTKGYGY